MKTNDMVFNGSIGIDGVDKYLDFIIVAVISFLGVPFFLDISKMTFFIRNVLTEGYLQGGMGGIPFPVFGFFLVFSLSFFAIINIKHMLKSFKKYDMILASACILFIITSVFSGYRIESIFQLIFFPLILWAVSFFRIDIKYAYWYSLGSLLFIVIHFLSILSLNGWSLLVPFSRYLVYETVFYYQIYQGLISYVNVLTIISVAILYLIVKSKGFVRVLVLSLGLILTLYLSALSAQRLFAVDLFLITMFIIGISIFNNEIHYRNKLVILTATIIVWILSIFAVHTSAGLSAPHRLINTAFGIADLAREKELSDLLAPTGDSAESGVSIIIDDSLNRVSHIGSTVTGIKSRLAKGSLSGIAYGTGKVHSGSHNFVLDLISGAGLLGAFCYFQLLVGAFWRLSRNAIAKRRKMQIGFLALLFFMVGAGSMVNAPLTQPYYFLNLLFVAWFISSDGLSHDVLGSES